MKLKSILSLVTILALIPPAVYGVIQIWEKLSSKETSVIIFSHKESINVHPDYRMVHRDSDEEDEIWKFLIPLNQSLYKVQKLEILNTGEKIAKNLRLLFGIRGNVKVFQKGKDMIEDKTEGEWVIESLHPDRKITLLFWPDPRKLALTMGLKNASFDNGKAKIVDRYVERTESNYVIAFGGWGIFMGIVLLYTLITCTYIIIREFLIWMQPQIRF